MRKEIYSAAVKFGNEAEWTSSLIAEYDYDEFQISPTVQPHDHVMISVKDGDKVIHSVFIGMDELEAIYLAAKEAQKNR